MNAVMEACVCCCDIDSALNNFYEMKNLNACGVDTVTFNVVSSSYSYVPFPFPSRGLWQ